MLAQKLFCTIFNLAQAYTLTSSWPTSYTHAGLHSPYVAGNSAFVTHMRVHKKRLKKSVLPITFLGLRIYMYIFFHKHISNSKDLSMADLSLRLSWLSGVVHSAPTVAPAVRASPKRSAAAVGDDTAIRALLLDRRLGRVLRSWFVSSFISGSVALFLPGAEVRLSLAAAAFACCHLLICCLCACLVQLFPGSTASAAVQPAALEQFTSLLAAVVPRQWQLRYRSTRDGATAGDFHRLCDGQGSTSVIIRDTDGNVFGGCTAVDWGSPDGIHSDASALLFTATNPHSDPPALFPSTGNRHSVYCFADCGPCFGDVWVTSESRLGAAAFSGDSRSHVGCATSAYLNTSRRHMHAVLTGDAHFTPAEVEVWTLA